MLRVIVSPAKKMLAGVESSFPLTVPALAGRTRELLDGLLGMTAAELQALWRVSDRLLGPCLDDLARLREAGVPVRAGDLAKPSLAASLSPAVLAYSGIQYQAMAPGVMDERSLAWLADHLRILSGFHGCLRPFDGVAPYRLEMGAKLPAGSRWPGGSRDLYGFWGDAIAREACAGEAPCDAGGAAAAVAAGPVHVVNLASVEYAKAALPWLSPDVPITTCIFGEELRDGRPVQRSTASKAARGSMVRWMAERGASDAAELEVFDIGYRLAPELCHEDGPRRTLVFMRAS